MTPSAPGHPGGPGALGPSPGLAHSWLGDAWVELVLHRAGLRPLAPGDGNTIARKLAREARGVHEGSVSLFVGSGGAALVAELLAAALPDRAEVGVVCRDRWYEDIARSDGGDYAGGAAGGLVGCAELHGIGGEMAPEATLATLHRNATAELRRNLAGERFVPGLAHGAAGSLLALELAEARLGLPFDESVREACFEALVGAAFAAPDGSDALYWPTHAPRSHIEIHGWCHGSPGIALALTHAYDATGIDAYGDVAKLALEATARHPDGDSTFCCGVSGRVQVLLEAYRVLGEDCWRRHAEELAQRIGPEPMADHSFHRGSLGVAYAALRTRHPELPLPGLAAAYFAPLRGHLDEMRNR